MKEVWIGGGSANVQRDFGVIKPPSPYPDGWVYKGDGLVDGVGEV